MTATERVLKEVGLDLGEWIDSIERAGWDYARRYLDAFIYGEPLPTKPQGMHPGIARAIRESVIDHVVATNGSLT